ncbi:hypothetical protein H5V45_02250 [Nocardioides sp. KIGAM211]|uniref:Uncharacterized protein n=1 Tax=Nocardioides luti TaxID=2761101 RepID=A0A7X0RDB3_9ACTN|nr:hypothetical protein [Nocardioides luti]MBB6626132.1 hypothetical protein [Nocardioides luti]
MIFGLLGLWTRSWREDLTSSGTYSDDSFHTANDLTHNFWAFAVIALLYVAISLLVTPRTPRVGAEASQVAEQA